jgi:hypothetical protein
METHQKAAHLGEGGLPGHHQFERLPRFRRGQSVAGRHSGQKVFEGIAHDLCGRRLLGVIDEVFQKGVPALGLDAFGVELHAINGLILMDQAHDFPGFGLSRNAEAIGDCFPIHEKGVVAGCGKWIG